ncbi:PKD-like family lipoprotein [Chitinophaga pollutisoli]|uniref:PKD-like family lipoprotein n=1 Tax=Chitinophaga pollutisoli TaxID=3133966 RepID=A0ABZ2YL89_9BACT
MKQYILLSAAMVILGSACMKDKGNYDYKPINEAAITLPAEVFTKLGDTLRLRPEIKLTQDGGDGSDTTRYAYKWVVELTLNSVQEINNTRDFNKPVDNLNVGQYTAAYYIKDKTTGVSYEKKFKLTITTAAYEGFMVLGALGDSSRLDMLAFDGVNADSTKLYTDVLTVFNSNYPRPIGKPLGMHTAVKNRDYQFFISTTTGTNSLERNTLKWEANKNISFLCFGRIPQGFLPEAFWSLGTTYGMFANDKIYVYTNASIFILNSPANHVKGETQPFRPSKFFNMVSTGLTDYLLMFDTEKRRFARVGIRTQDRDSYASLLLTPTSAKFDYNDVKMDLVWMSSNAVGGNVFAVLKNDAGEYWFAMFNPATLEQPIYKKMNVGPDMANAKHFAADPSYATLYYGSGNKLYAYLPDANREVLVENFGEKISFMYFPNNITNNSLYLPYRNNLMVATFNASLPATGGTLRFFKTNSQGSVPQATVTTTHGGFAEPVGVAFRSRSGNY